MTNEEASIIVGNIPINGDECYTIPEYQQAKAMAIKALEQQPCEDAISRKDMLAIFRQSNSLSQAWNGFEKLPPVTPKSKSEYEHDHEVVKAYNDGQAYILDKIRAEVEQRQKEQSNHYGNETETAKYDAYDDCLDVIDKYREVIYEADSN